MFERAGSLEFNMESRALDQAIVRLVRAEKALTSFESSENYSDAEDAWIDFLVAASTIYSKLEQGAKGDGACEAWFGRKKNERRKDPLLRYLHFARNSAEHGVEPVTNRRDGVSPIFGPPLKFGERRDYAGALHDQSGKVIADGLQVMQMGPSIRLVRAHDSRFNDFCDPPTHHFDQRIQFHDLMPTEVGKLGLEYLRKLIAEAERFRR